jgi:hypothetical protein
MFPNVTLDILIAPVGRQPMPIVLPILQYRPRTTYLLVSAEVSEVGKQICNAVEVLAGPGAPAVLVHSPQVDAHDSAATMAICAALAENRRAAVNISGGTTMMALGAQQAARALSLPMLYVNTDDDCVLWLAPDGTALGAEALTVAVPAAQYLQAHGATLHARSTRPTDIGQAFAARAEWLQPWIAAAHVIAAMGERSCSLLDSLRAAEATHERMVNVAPADEAFCAQLVEQRLLERVERHKGGMVAWLPSDTHTLEFLRGKWLELYVAERCRAAGIFDDVQCSRLVTRPATPKPVENDLDVLVTRRGSMAVVSCKTGRELFATGDKQPDRREKRRIAVWEMDALLQSELMGLYSRKLLVTNRSAGSLDPILRGMVSASRTRAVGGEELTDVARIVHSHLTARM